MFCEKTIQYSRYLHLTKIVIVKLWLQDNVGPQNLNLSTMRYSPHEKEFQSIVDRFHADWKRHVSWDIDDIAQIGGDGWMIYITTETDYTREDGKHLMHCVYVAMPDEHMLLQCKLACL